jgi:hypothetical protein
VAYNTDRGVIDNHLVPKLSTIRLQEVKSIDIEACHDERSATLSPAAAPQAGVSAKVSSNPPFRTNLRSRLPTFA